MQFAQSMKNCGRELGRIQGIRWIFFDLDNTLYPADELYSIGLENAYRYLNSLRPVSFNSFIKQYQFARKKVKRLLGVSPSARNRVIYFKWMVENIFGKPKPRVILNMVKAYDACWSSIRVEDVRWVFKKLSVKYKIGVITNQVCQTQLQKLYRIDPDSKWIDVLITSEEAGAEKPQYRIFKEACRRAHCSPKECAMVGDSWDHDILGSLRAGFYPIFVNRTENHGRRDIPTFKNIREVVGFFYE